MRGLPTNCFFDQWSTPSDPTLYVAFAGRGIVKISGLGLDGGVILLSAAPVEEEVHSSPVERPPRTVVTADGRSGTAEFMPDGRVMVTVNGEEPRVMEDDEITVI